MAATRTEAQYLIALLSINGFSAQGSRISDTEIADTLDEYFAIAVAVIEASGGRVVKVTAFSPSFHRPRPTRASTLCST